MRKQRSNKAISAKDNSGMRQRSVQGADFSVHQFDDQRPEALQMKRLQEMAGRGANPQSVSQLQKVINERIASQRYPQAVNYGNQVAQLVPSDRLKELDTLTDETLAGEDFLNRNVLSVIKLEKFLTEVNTLAESDADGTDLKESLKLRIENAIGELKAKANADRSAWTDSIAEATGKRPAAVNKPPGAYHAAPGRWAEEIATNGIKPGSSGEKGLDQLYSCFAPTVEGMAVLGGAKPVAFRIKSAYLHNFSFIRWGAGGTAKNKEIRCLGPVPAECLECTPFYGSKHGVWVDAQTQLRHENDPAYKGRKFLIVSEAVKAKYDKEAGAKKAKVEAAKKNKVGGEEGKD